MFFLFFNSPTTGRFIIKFSFSKMKLKSWTDEKEEEEKGRTFSRERNVFPSKNLFIGKLFFTQIVSMQEKEKEEEFFLNNINCILLMKFPWRNLISTTFSKIIIMERKILDSIYLWEFSSGNSWVSFSRKFLEIICCNRSNFSWIFPHFDSGWENFSVFLFSSEKLYNFLPFCALINLYLYPSSGIKE